MYSKENYLSDEFLPAIEQVFTGYRTNFCEYGCRFLRVALQAENRTITGDKTSDCLMKQRAIRNIYSANR